MHKKGNNKKINEIEKWKQKKINEGKSWCFEKKNKIKFINL